MINEWWYNDADTQLGKYQRQIESVTGTASFCILPWIHFATRPNGDMRLCCSANSSGAGKDHIIGLVKTENGKPANFGRETPMQAWNNDYMKSVRTTMLKGEIPASCTKCFQEEKLGVVSKRIWETGTWEQEGIDIPELIKQTQEDGTVPENLIYLDLRLGHTCNLKCIMCSPHDSSQWVADQKKLIPIVQDFEVKRQMSWNRKEFDNFWHEKETFWEEMYKQIPNLKQVYFAGGEPLIMEEHNRILKLLIAKGNTRVRLIYNTNLTELKFKKESVLDLWKHFPTVCVAASLDDMGQRAAVIRSGTNWAQVEQNIRDLKRECPHIDFMISPTLSMMNIWNFVNFHRYMIDQGFIQPKDFNLNILQGPKDYRIDMLPMDIKLKFKKQFKNTLNIYAPLTPYKEPWADLKARLRS